MNKYLSLFSLAVVLSSSYFYSCSSDENLDDSKIDVKNINEDETGMARVASKALKMSILPQNGGFINDIARVTGLAYRTSLAQKNKNQTSARNCSVRISDLLIDDVLVLVSKAPKLDENGNETGKIITTTQTIGLDIEGKINVYCDHILNTGEGRFFDALIATDLSYKTITDEDGAEALYIDMTNSLNLGAFIKANKSKEADTSLILNAVITGKILTTIKPKLPGLFSIANLDKIDIQLDLRPLSLTYNPNTNTFALEGIIDYHLSIGILNLRIPFSGYIETSFDAASGLIKIKSTMVNDESKEHYTSEIWINLNDPKKNPASRYFN